MTAVRFIKILMIGTAIMSEHFDSASSALRYAFGQRNGYGRSAASRMADESHGPDGLGPTDQSAMAGMILAEVSKLGRAAEHVLSVRYMRRSLPCQCQALCCSGRRPNEDWLFASAYLSEAIRTGPLNGRATTFALRQALIDLALGASKRSVADVARNHNVDRHTIAAWLKLINKWLLQVERKAFDEFEAVARERGWVADCAIHG